MDCLSTQNSSNTGVDKWMSALVGCSGNALLQLLLLLSMIALLAGCTKPLSHRQEMVRNRPEKKVYKANTAVVREAAVRVLEKKKFYLDPEKSTPLHLETEWLEDGGYRSMAVIDIKALARSRTELELQMLLEKKVVFQDKWKPVDEIGADTYKMMLGDIEMECYRVLYDRS